ncbi:hypothetical protein DY000_02053758 [Brassica cretica]|uniref:FBD domain-containing protein n=1 Tax=Brassica cretica TaxID=69181 RepID=A0ABQ7AIN5_BRACR|nr:hypothetical protein DY000_02053758 [Brassica cretica]
MAFRQKVSFKIRSCVHNDAKVTKNLLFWFLKFASISRENKRYGVPLLLLLVFLLALAVELLLPQRLRSSVVVQAGGGRAVEMREQCRGVVSAAATEERTSMSISFDTPSLLYLEYSDEVARYYLKVNLPNLVEAVLDLNIRDLDYMKLYRERNDDGLRNYVVLRCGNLCKLMIRIGNLFSICFESMPTFNNLKMLRISGSVHPVGWQAMPVLLQNCPHLETLQMEYLCVWDCISLEEKGGWLISCPVEKIVEKILIEMFRGTKGAIGTVKHLLESLSCLKEITLFAGRDYPTDIFDLVVKMVNLCNGSYRAVVKNASWCVIRLIYEVDS